MGIFRFKKFEVKNEASALKVNTDAVLLGASTIIEGKDNLNVLDAGTGTGTIALMLAQRLEDCGTNYHVLGIDIDEASAIEASENFSASPWAEKMECRHIALDECDGAFDLIVSNPPYFEDSLKNPDARKNRARHTAASDVEGVHGSAMSYRSLLRFANEKLNENGSIALILPADQEASLLRYGRMYGFIPFSIIRVRTVERKVPSRIIVQFRRNNKGPKSCDCEPSILTIMENGEYSALYRSLVADFYLWG